MSDTTITKPDAEAEANREQDDAVFDLRLLDPCPTAADLVRPFLLGMDALDLMSCRMDLLATAQLRWEDDGRVVSMVWREEAFKALAETRTAIDQICVAARAWLVDGGAHVAALRSMLEEMTGVHGFSTEIGEFGKLYDETMTEPLTQAERYAASTDAMTDD